MTTYTIFKDSLFDGDGGRSGSDVVSSVPSALSRWTEEARVLDGDSIHDAMTGELCLLYELQFH